MGGVGQKFLMGVKGSETWPGSGDRRAFPVLGGGLHSKQRPLVGRAA